MADDTRLNTGTGGDLIGTDEPSLINGVANSTNTKIQRIKAGFGSDGVYRDVDALNPLPVTTATKATYRAATAAVLVTATTASIPWFIITGSATKTVKVQSILVSGVTLTAVAYLNTGCAKYSAIPTGGTATTFTKVSLDSGNAAATANLVQGYTVAPTGGTKVGDISARRHLGQATTAAAAGIPEELNFDFSDGKDGGCPVLRGTAEGIGLYWITAPASAVSLLVRVEWTEE